MILEMDYFTPKAELLASGQKINKCDKIGFISYQPEATACLAESDD